MEAARLAVQLVQNAASCALVPAASEQQLQTAKRDACKCSIRRTCDDMHAATCAVPSPASSSSCHARSCMASPRGSLRLAARNTSNAGTDDVFNTHHHHFTTSTLPSVSLGPGHRFHSQSPLGACSSRAQDNRGNPKMLFFKELLIKNIYLSVTDRLAVTEVWSLA